MRIAIIVFLLIGSLTLVGCGENDKVISNISNDEVVSDEFKNRLKKRKN